ncbi:GAF domain-containing protein [Microbacterium xanthum]|uniref:GAF domain-containing protein n=1 Tax=Microbacterium xanthum TaxID=3079794 RepID=UPI002AD59173|nr:GAF domain-containing protein [Microbacterium sp. KSW-48]MDZ8170806.1 GAF domain-containing protein [Microbacterium sp. KSW-48]
MSQEFAYVETAPEVLTPSGHLRAITESAAELAGQFELQPLLERILRSATRLLGCHSGSISLVDEVAGTYTKRVDVGVGCSEGQTFSLDQGVTGEIVRTRSAVVLHSYSAISAGHISADDPRWSCAVLGVPIRWGDRIIGSCVIFGDEPHRLFTTTDAELAELFASHAAIALANAEMHTRLSKRDREIAVAHEREGVVRDVQSTVGHALRSMVIDLHQANELLSPSHPAREHIDEARQRAEAALMEARRTAAGIGPTALEGGTLEQALSDELNWVSSVAPLQTALSVSGSRREVSAEVSHQLLRIAQEALTNVVNHARAATVRVGLLYSSHSVTLLVEDDGRGFVPASHGYTGPRSPAGGLGLHGISSRVTHLGGELDIESIEGWGTKVRVVLPEMPDAIATPTTAPWKVLISSTQPLVSAGLVRVLQLHEPSMQIVTEGHDSDDLLASIDQVAPDVVVVDLDTHERALPQIAERLKAVNSRAAIVAYMESPNVDQIRLTRDVGVRGYLTKRSSPDAIARSIVAAGEGVAMIDAGLYEHLLDNGGSATSPGERLTAREVEVRGLVAKGMADKQIATELGISVKTVEKHVGSLLRKCGAHNRTMLAGMGETAPTF